MAGANQKDGDGVVVGPSRETGCGVQQLTWRPRARM